MAPVLADQHLGQLAGIGQVAVVAEADAVGRIHVEWLRIVGVVRAGRRVTHVSDADVAAQFDHVLLLEDIAHQARVLAHVELARLAGHDAGRILTAVLQDGQRIVDSLIHGTDPDHSDDTAHVRNLRAAC